MREKGEHFWGRSPRAFMYKFFKLETPVIASIWLTYPHPLFASQVADEDSTTSLPLPIRFVLFLLLFRFLCCFFVQLLCKWHENDNCSNYNIKLGDHGSQGFPSVFLHLLLFPFFGILCSILFCCHPAEFLFFPGGIFYSRLLCILPDLFVN